VERTSAAVPSEKTIIFLVGAVQFVNIFDFMMVMPLGPDFAAALRIPTSSLGIIGGSYTAAAAVAGVIGARFLDRFDRRTALGLAMVGLILGTAAGAAATGLGSLVLARVIAGAFGGPATSLALSIIADVVPAQRRGRAMGAVMGAFSVASVLGVPAGLRLSRMGGWRLPFLAVAGLGVIVVAAAIRALPPLRLHLANRTAGAARAPRLSVLLASPTVRLALGTNMAVMMAAFLVIPNISPHLLQNLAVPRPRLEVLYMVGGLVSFAVMRIAGNLVDRAGAPVVAGAGTALLLANLYGGFVAFDRWPVAVLPLFVTFMMAMSLRNVSLTTLTSRVPGPTERAGYMSLQSTAQHIASASGAFLSSRMLQPLPNGRLGGMPAVATASMALAALLPLLLHRLDRRLRLRDAQALAA
jgi:predicted MFS family arabinose efflux permease